MSYLVELNSKNLIDLSDNDLRIVLLQITHYGKTVISIVDIFLGIVDLEELLDEMEQRYIPKDCYKNAQHREVFKKLLIQLAAHF